MDWTDSTRPTAIVAAPLAMMAMLTACSVAGPRTSPLPKSGPTMEQIYRERAGDAHRERAREALPPRSPSDATSGPARELAADRIERRFARLPNPDLFMVVFPHLADGKYPVPGYTTAFPMYERVEYLLPGEGEVPPPESPPRWRAAPSVDETARRQSPSPR